MAELQQRGQQGHPTESIKSMFQEKGPTASQALSVAALLPVGGILLALSCFTLLGTVVGLAITTPLFVIFSPVLVPAAITIGLAVTGFLASGAFGVTALTAMSWIWSYVTRGRGMPEQMEHMKRRMGETAGHVGQRTKDVGQGIQTKAGERT